MFFIRIYTQIQLNILHVFKPLIIIPVLSSIFVFVSIEDFVFPGIGVLKGTIAGTTIDPAVIFNGYLQKKYVIQMYTLKQ